MSPVNAGIRAASNVPELMFAALVVSVVADAANPAILLLAIAAEELISALTILPSVISAEETPNDN
jgi:hypothetical protein